MNHEQDYRAQYTMEMSREQDYIAKIWAAREGSPATVDISNPTDTLRNNDVVITSKRRHFDVITSKWRRFDVITTLLLRHVFSGK